MCLKDRCYAGCCRILSAPSAMARDERVGFALRRLREDDRSLVLRAQVPHHNDDINTIIDKDLDFHYVSSSTASPGPPPCATPMRTWRTARMEASQPSPMLLLYFSSHTLSMATSIAPMRSTADPVANGAPSDLTCPQSNLHLTLTRRHEFSTERAVRTEKVRLFFRRSRSKRA